MSIAVRHAEDVLAAVDPGHGVPMPRPGRRASMALALHAGLTYGQICDVLGMQAEMATAQLRAGLADLGSLPVGVSTHA